MRCQDVLLRSAERVVRARFRSLAKCEKSLQRCVQLRADDPSCVEGAADRCARALARVRREEASRSAAVARGCPQDLVAPADLLARGGLGFELVAAECAAEFGTVAEDVATIFACILRQHACHVERMVEVVAPRTRELLRLPPDGGIVVEEATCLPDHGGLGEALEPTLGGALTRCSSAVAKAGAAFVRRGLQSHAKCAGAVLRCLQLDADDPRCLAKAAATCDQRLGRRVRDREHLTRAVVLRCDPARIPFAALQMPAGAALMAVEPVCASLGVPAPATLTEYEECLARHQRCRLAELVRLAAPRAGELLALVGYDLGDASCPGELPLQLPPD